MPRRRRSSGVDVDIDLGAILRMIREERERARKVVAEVLGGDALVLLEGVKDYKVVGDKVDFYVSSPGKINAIDVSKLVEAVKKLFKVEDPQVEDRGSGEFRTIVIRDSDFKLSVLCVESAHGCQAEARIGGEVYDCKITCYGLRESNKRVTMALALALAYANVPPEHSTAHWSG